MNRFYWFYVSKLPTWFLVACFFVPELTKDFVCVLYCTQFVEFSYIKTFHFMLSPDNGHLAIQAYQMCHFILYQSNQINRRNTNNYNLCRHFQVSNKYFPGDRQLELECCVYSSIELCHSSPNQQRIPWSWPEKHDFVYMIGYKWSEL